MNSIQRVRKFLSGLGMLLGSLILMVKPEEGYYIIAILLSLSLMMLGIRSLVFYVTMARNMVGGKSILYRALIFMDLGFFYDDGHHHPEDLSGLSFADIPRIFRNRGYAEGLRR